MASASVASASVASASVEESDLIRKLPDSLLCSIISLLPVEEAIRTSIIARQWRFLWRFITRLDFDLKRMTKQHNQVQMLRNQPGGVRKRLKLSHHVPNAVGIMDVISSSHQSNILSCKIVLPKLRSNQDEVIKWIEYLTKKKGIEELTLICEPSLCRHGNYLDGKKKKFELPYAIFSCRTLHMLELTNFMLENASPFEGCKNIRTLKLNSVFLGDAVVDEIIHNWKLLENLSLSSCTGIKKLKICDQKLKGLELQALALTEIEICAKELVVLVLDTISCPAKGMVINTPNLTVLRAYCKPELEKKKHLTKSPDRCLKPVEILEYCSGLLESQYGGCYRLDCNNKSCPSPFENLQTLSINFDLNNIREAIVLSYIFRVCIHLQKLDITIQRNKAISDPSSKNRSLPYAEYMFWDRRELSDSISHHLRFTSIRGYRGNLQETEFVKYLITRATVMERVIIHFDDYSSKEDAIAAFDLLSLPKASINLSIVLKPGRTLLMTCGDFENWVTTMKYKLY